MPTENIIGWATSFAFVLCSWGWTEDAMPDLCWMRISCRGVTGAARSCSSSWLGCDTGRWKSWLLWQGNEQQRGKSLGSWFPNLHTLLGKANGTKVGPSSWAELLGQSCCPRRRGAPSPQCCGPHKHMWVPKLECRNFCSQIWTRCSDSSGLGTEVQQSGCSPRPDLHSTWVTVWISPFNTSPHFSVLWSPPWAFKPLPWRDSLLIRYRV